MLVRVHDFIFPDDFVVLEMEEDKGVQLILGRPFLRTGGALIDVSAGQLTLRIGKDSIVFNMKKALTHSSDEQTCFWVEDYTSMYEEYLKVSTEEEDEPETEQKEEAESVDAFEELKEQVVLGHEEPVPELKPLPDHLRYKFLDSTERYPVIVAAILTDIQVDQLLRILTKYKQALGWSISDIKGISPTVCTHKILLEDGHKPSVERQRRLNPKMKEVVGKEVLKWRKAGIIYAISDSEWVAPVHVVPKKGGMTVITNEKNELLPTRTVTG